MPDIVIKAENLGKKYVIGHQTERVPYLALRDVWMQNARTLWNKTKDLAKGKPVIQGDTTEEVWALKDVNFEIRSGEAVGIIGRNGAGKSTLLKILSRITEPSAGRVTINGRVASLLEVGTGFHPELSGRENIYLNGTILGMTRKEIKRKFDEIVAFAEVEKYLDTPVKRYSSGMYVRLAFAVAAHLEPEILVVDEVLAVGDAEFQKRCIGKMNQLASNGRTVLFVSHNLAAVGSLTNRSILLKNGFVSLDSVTDDVIIWYLKSANGESSHYIAEKDTYPYISNISLITSDGGGIQRNGQPLVIQVKIKFDEPIPKACFSFQIFNEMGVAVAHCWQYEKGQNIGGEPGIYLLTFTIPKVRLNIGNYSLTCHLTEPPGGRAFERLKNVCNFSVEIIEGTTLFGWRRDACTYHEQYTCEAMRIGDVC
jgi:lipopolysaccharide transport system ATP-binding protein